MAFFCSLEVLAVDLYTGEVTVKDRSAAERGEAVPAALIQVLQKLSGQRELPLGPALDAALLSANRIMVSFHYQGRARTGPDGSVSDELWLVASFLPEAVDRISRDLELPRWRRERLPVAIWVVVDDGLGRRFKPLEYGYAWDSMTDLAALRGLPVSWPDPLANPDRPIDLQLLWGGFTEEVIDPLAPEGGALIVAARRMGPEWNIRWTWSDGQETAGWRTRGQDLSISLAEGLHSLADHVAARHSIAASAHGYWQVRLDIAGIGDAGDYARCLAYLQGLSLVENVDVEEISGGTVRFVVDVNARPDYLGEAIARGRVLERGATEQEYRMMQETDQSMPDPFGPDQAGPPRPVPEVAPQAGSEG